MLHTPFHHSGFFFLISIQAPQSSDAYLIPQGGVPVSDIGQQSDQAEAEALCNWEVPWKTGGSNEIKHQIWLAQHAPFLTQPAKGPA